MFHYSKVVASAGVVLLLTAFRTVDLYYFEREKPFALNRRQR